MTLDKKTLLLIGILVCGGFIPLSELAGLRTSMWAFIGLTSSLGILFFFEILIPERFK